VRGEDVNFESPDVRQSGAITSSTRPGSQTDHCQRRAPDNSENPLHPWSPLSLSSALLVRKPFAIKPGNLGSAQKNAFWRHIKHLPITYNFFCLFLAVH